MADELVNAVLNSLESTAFANSIRLDSLHPVVDVLVNRMRYVGMSDEAIRDVLAPQEAA